MNPWCPKCGAALLRWSWFEWPGEDYKYWYCLECDKAERMPIIYFIYNKLLWLYKYKPYLRRPE